MEEEQPFINAPASTSPEPPPMVGDAAPMVAATDADAALAPWWSVVVLIAFILVMSFAGAGGKHHDAARSPLYIYLPTVVMQWGMVAFVWWSLHRRGNRLRDLIGGQWRTVEDFFMDVIFAAGAYVTFIIGAMLFVSMQILTHATNQNALSQTAEKNQQMLSFMLPHTGPEIAMMIFVCLTAGFCEEVIFRGLIQKQFVRWMRSAWLALPAAAIVFGLAHGYQGIGNMIKVGFLGLLLGGLAHWRKSLRPGMLMHAANDMIAFFVMLAVQQFGPQLQKAAHGLFAWLM